MSTDNEFISNFQESTAENNVDLGSKFVSKSYLIDVYPYLDGLGNNIITAGLWIWGYNVYGELGDNTTTSRSSPIQTISGGTTWTQVDAGIYHTAAIKTDSTLWVCGLNGNGQLGDSTVAARLSPVQTITGGTNWKQVATGAYHTVAIKTDGTLWNWGYNFYAQLGDSTRTHRSSPVQTIAGGTTWKQVSGGYYHATAIKEMGDDF